jgi:hypothetical protein
MFKFRYLLIVFSAFTLANCLLPTSSFAQVQNACGPYTSAGADPTINYQISGCTADANVGVQINAPGSASLNLYNGTPSSSGGNISGNNLYQAINLDGNNLQVGDIINYGTLASGRTSSFASSGIFFTGTNPTIGAIINASSGVIRSANTDTSPLLNDLPAAIEIITSAGGTATGNVGLILNQGTISGSTGSSGINNQSTIAKLINTGTISTSGTTANGYFGYKSYSTGSSGYGNIGTLSNAQGVGNAAGALTYSGNLPSNYNIIVNSSSSYGQLNIFSTSLAPYGTMSFGVFGGDSYVGKNNDTFTIAKSTLGVGTYLNVLQGLNGTLSGSTITGTGWSVTNTTGNYTNLDGTTFSYSLVSAGTGFWNLVVLSTTTNISVADTQSSLDLSAQRLKGIFNLHSTAVINGLTYDCQLFDANNICLSTGGRYSNNHGESGSTTSALLIGAYRLNNNIRLGTWVDQNLSTNTVTGIKLSNSKPLFGLFGAWAENPSGEGYEVKVSAGYGDKDLMVTRDVIGTSEAGKGTTRLNSQAISTVSSYGFKLDNDLVANPYVGVQYSRISSDAYSETSATDVTAPLTYGRLSQEKVSVLAGLKLSAKLDPKTALFGSVGVEQNVNNRSGQYSATGVDGLTAVNFNSNVQKTRATASAGIYYDIDEKKRVSLSGMYREEAFSPTATTSVLATYTVGF